MAAAHHNQNTEVAKRLLKAGAEINAKDKFGWTALMEAAAHAERPEMILALLTAGADAKIKNNDGRTALDLSRGNPKLKDTEAHRTLERASK